MAGVVAAGIAGSGEGVTYPSHKTGLGQWGVILEAKERALAVAPGCHVAPNGSYRTQVVPGSTNIDSRAWPNWSVFDRLRKKRMTDRC